MRKPSKSDWFSHLPRYLPLLCGFLCVLSFTKAKHLWGHLTFWCAWNQPHTSIQCAIAPGRTQQKDFHGAQSWTLIPKRIRPISKPQLCDQKSRPYILRKIKQIQLWLSWRVILLTEITNIVISLIATLYWTRVRGRCAINWCDKRDQMKKNVFMLFKRSILPSLTKQLA